jgi:hypothetical protein
MYSKYWFENVRDYTLRVFPVQGLTSNMERSMKNVLNLLGTEMGRIRELDTTSQQINQKTRICHPQQLTKKEKEAVSKLVIKRYSR